MKNKNISKKYLFLFVSVFLLILFGQISEAKASWRYEGVAYYVPWSSTGNRPVYRFYSPLNKTHFFTTSENEKNTIISTYTENEWRYEGIAYYVPWSSAENRPVYRFYSPLNKTHFFTTSENEKNTIISTYTENEWRYEGIAYYVPWSSAENRPVYRFFHTENRAHFFTISENEKERLLIAGLGPEITVGLWSFTRDELESDPFEIDANKDYVIKNDNGKIIGTVNKDTRTKVKYNGSGELRVYNSISDTISDEIVYFEAADGNNSDMIFDTHLPGYSYDEYRGKITLDYSSYEDPNTGEDVKRIWVINALPLEHYVQGDGELAGTGDMDHNRVMVTSFRTYGYWWIQYATKWARAGFKVNATPGNQIYRGYEYEEAHPRVREAAEDTRGKIVTYKGETAITPYSSWTDGKTRSFEERWGSDDYPWCDSVDDPYGDYNADYWDHSYKSTGTLESEGNHMVGLSAHGSLYLAEEKNWSWTKILSYYFDDIDISKIY